MIESLKGRVLLSGFRGEPPSDVPAAGQALLRLDRLVQDFRGSGRGGQSVHPGAAGDELRVDATQESGNDRDGAPGAGAGAKLRGHVIVLAPSRS